MPVVKPISDQTRALTTIQEREDHIQRTIAHGYDDLTNGRVRPWNKRRQRQIGSSHQVRSPLPHVTIL